MATRDRITEEEWAFLISSPQRLVNESAVSLRYKLRKHRITSIKSSQTAQLIQIIEKTQHPLTIIEKGELQNHRSSNTIDSLIVDEDDLASVLEMIEEDHQPDTQNIRSIMALKRTEGSLPENIMPIYTPPTYLAFLNALIRKECLAPLYVLSDNIERATKCAKLIENLHTHFKAYPQSPEEFKRNLSQVKKGVILYIDNLDNLQECNQPISLIMESDIPTVVAGGPIATKKKFEHVNAMFKAGMLTYCWTDIMKFLEEPGNITKDSSRSMIATLESICNACTTGLHIKKERFEEKPEAWKRARDDIPNILLVCREKLARKYMEAIQFGVSANTFFLDITYNSPKQFDELTHKCIQISGSMKPNIIYLELKSSETPDAQRKNKKLLHAVLTANERSQIIVAYDQTVQNIEIAEREKSRTTILDKSRGSSYVPAMRHIIANTWAQYQSHRPPNLSTRRIHISSPRLPPGTVEEVTKYLASKIGFPQGVQPATVTTAKGVAPGAATGRVYKFSSNYHESEINQALEAITKGDSAIVYVDDLSSMDLSSVKQLLRASGVMFKKISFTNHNTIILLKSGVPAIQIASFREDKEGTRITGHYINDTLVKNDDYITFDGTTGEVFDGTFPIIKSDLSLERIAELPDIPPHQEFKTQLKLADKFLAEQNAKIMINADSVADITSARKWGVYEVGLTRSENIVKHSEEQMVTLGKLVLSLAARIPNVPNKTVDNLVHQFRLQQQQAYYDILKFQQGNRTQIRLLDPPLYQLFTVQQLIDIQSDLRDLEDKTHFVSGRAWDLITSVTNREEAPRGAQLLSTMPEIYQAQIAAVFGACHQLIAEGEPVPDVRPIIPYVTEVEQVRTVKKMNNDEYQNAHSSIVRELGVTLETPTGCAAVRKLVQELKIKNYAIGTNDLIPLLQGIDRRTPPPPSQINPVVNESTGAYVFEFGAGVKDFIHNTIRELDSAAREVDVEYQIGMCGEMDDNKLHRLNFGSFLHKLNYFSASRPQQIPILKLLLYSNMT